MRKVADQYLHGIYKSGALMSSLGATGWSWLNFIDQSYKQVNEIHFTSQKSFLILSNDVWMSIHIWICFDCILYLQNEWKENTTSPAFSVHTWYLQQNNTSSEILTHIFQAEVNNNNKWKYSFKMKFSE